MIIDASLTFRGARPGGGEQKNIDAIVIHHAAGNGTVESIHAYHKDKLGWWGIGYHYYIRKDGKIYRGRPEKFVGSHAGSGNNYNNHSIGICFEGNFEIESPTEQQIASGRWLVADIQSRYKIKEVLPHRMLSATACPGKNFPLDDLTATPKYLICLEFTSRQEAEIIAKIFKSAVVKEV